MYVTCSVSQEGVETASDDESLKVAKKVVENDFEKTCCKITCQTAKTFNFDTVYLTARFLKLRYFSYGQIRVVGLTQRV